MDHRRVRYPYAGRMARKRTLNGPCGAVTVALLAASLTACTDGSAAVVKPAMYVRTEIVQPRVRQGSVTLTGELQARFGADLSFRVSGRVRERLVEIGTQVAPGTVLARLDATEQQADLDAATSAVTAAGGAVCASRKRRLTGRIVSLHAASRRAWRSIRRRKDCELPRARSKGRRRSWARQKMPLGIPSCAPSASGIITARSLEVGQVVRRVSPVFSLAQDGERDAVFDDL